MALSKKPALYWHQDNGHLPNSEGERRDIADR